MLNQEQEIMLQLLLKKYGSVTTQVANVVQTDTTKIVKKRKAQRGNQHWSVNEIKQLVDMHIQGIHTLTIARTMCRSHASVRTMKSHVFGELTTERPPMVKNFWEQHLHKPFYAIHAPQKI